MAPQTAQIYRIDDLLIRTGFIVMALVLIMLLAVQPWSGRLSPPALAWITLASAAPVAMLWAGFGVRRKENRIRAIWRLLERSLEVDVGQLMRASSFTRDQVAEAVRVLNDRGLGHYVWDDANQVVRDGRLEVQIAHEMDCGTCGAAVSVSLSMSDAPDCPYCGAPLGTEAVNEARRRTIDRLQSPAARPAPAPAPATHAPVVQPKRMSTSLFILLLVFCWSAALVYAIYHNRR